MLKLLDNVRVLELGHILMAPYATQFLGDMGADVIKVEPLGGDLYRGVGLGRSDGMSAQWMGVNRNKRSVALDLKSEDGRQVLREMIASADILVHNMRPPAIERLGFGYDAVKALNPRLVYCAAIGFGRDGPYADYPAFDDVIQARSGLADVNGRMTGKPTFVPVAIADKVVGLMVGQAMLAGLHRQRATGEGCYLETPMFEAMVGVVLNQHLNGHAFRPPEGGLGYARVTSPYRHPSPTADGYIVHGVYKYPQWQRFLAHVGRQDILDGPLMRDARAMAQGIGQLYEITTTEILPQKSTAEWGRILDELDIPHAPVLSIEELENDPHLQAVGLFEDYEHPTQGPMRHVRAPFGARDVDEGPDRYPPDLGAHGPEVLEEFGLSPTRIAALRAAGILGGA
ncbi:CaiB/BaiF CoA transferase family protein [Pseudooceanicola aestuarii]|uniref:CaiB/BaiF CoA transferase family protein n=1 Tax=Pseudooceanicola aestuarii TaxID=2697319 RepID=UPI0013D2C622|nr:CoA transferase [Pseudooceanicola aestuarii]